MQNTTKWKKRDQTDRAISTKDYFGPKAEVYDLTDTQSYWVFSDQLLWKLLDKYCLKPLADSNKNFHFLDAGCGTARWSSKILQNYSNCTATLLDITPEMLSVRIAVRATPCLCLVLALLSTARMPVLM